MNNNNNNSSDSFHHSIIKSKNDNYISSSSKPINSHSQSHGTTTLSRNPSLSTISSKSTQAPALIIRHGIPSPPPTVRSDNSIWTNPIHSFQLDNHSSKNQNQLTPPIPNYHINTTTTNNQNLKQSYHHPPPNSSPASTSTSPHSIHSKTSPSAHLPLRRSSYAMKAVKNQLSQAQQDSSAEKQKTRISSGSPLSHQQFSRNSSIRQTQKISHPNRNPSASTSNSTSTTDGLMPFSSSQLESTPFNRPQDLTSHHQDTSKLNNSFLSNATVKPKTRSPSESSSTDLRVSKLKFKDRSKDSSLSGLNEQSVSRSKKLTTMKERNDRIFASINASLKPQPSHVRLVEPPLPPPPPSTSSRSPTSPTGSISLTPDPELSFHLKVPEPAVSRSGLISFAQDSSPNPRKITGSEPHATNDKTDPSVLPSSVMDSDTNDDERFGSVRHKQPQRCRLLKRTPTSDNATNSVKHKPPPSERDSIDEDNSTKQVEPKHSPYLMPRPHSANTDQSHSLTDCHESSETISMHTSSSDTIGVGDRSRVQRSSSRNSVTSSHPDDSSPISENHSDQDPDDYRDHPARKAENMITPVKTKRSDSYQQTLPHANSINEMLPAASNGHNDIGPVAWTPRAATLATHRRPSSDQHETTVTPTEMTSPVDLPIKQSNSTNLLPSPRRVHRSPQSHASLSRRPRPGLPDHFVLSRQTDRAESEIYSMTETHRSELQSSLSPRSDRARRTHSISVREQPKSGGRAYRHSDTFVPGSDRINGVESALSRYDDHHSLSDRRKFSSNRNKHASWSVLEELGKDLTRSQSVLGGSAYDARITESRRVAAHPRTSHMSPLSRRYDTQRSHAVEDDDDDQTSTTTYTNIQSMPRKAGSADSRSRTSEWGFEDQDYRNKSVHSGPRLGGHTKNLYTSPSRRKSVLEKDRTLRVNGSAAMPTIKPFTQLLRNTYQEKNSANHNTDALSSSSGTNSSKRLQSQRSVIHGLSPSANANFHSRPPTRSASLAAIGLTALLSPTPTVDHHNLLISAYEALDRPQEETTQEVRDLQLALNGLLSSVIKNNCKIDATLVKLNESSLNHQVEMELADDYIDNAHEINSHSKQPSSDHITRQKYHMMKDSLAHMAKVQGQLVRTSNDQIRDLTEVLICLSKLHRAQKESTISRQVAVVPTWVASSDEPRDLHRYVETNPKDCVRSGSRAGAGYSRSHSPSKLRHTIDLSPLSIISSHDGSLPSQAKSNTTVTLPDNTVTHSRRLAGLATSPRLQHNRASTISFAHQRYLSIEGLPPQLSRAQKRSSGLSCNSIHQMRDTPPYPQRSESRSSVAIDEFGLYRKSSDQTLRSPVEFKYPNHDESWSRTESARNTVRGSHPSAVFPKTPPRVATSSLSHATAHSHVSPTRPHRSSIESRSQRIDRDPGRLTRPSTSMSTVLDRAHQVLSRTGHHPTVSGAPPGRKQNGNIFERYSKEPSPDDSRFSSSSRRNENNTNMDVSMYLEHSLNSRAGRRRDEEQTKSNSTASASLERLNLTRGGGSSHVGHQQHLHHEGESRMTSLGSKSTTTRSHLPSSSNSTTSTSNNSRDSESGDHHVELRKEFFHKNSLNHPPSAAPDLSLRSRKGSIQKLFGGLKRNHPHVKN